MVYFLNQLLLAITTATCAWAFIFALIGHKAKKEGTSFASGDICGRLFGLLLMTYPLLLLTYLYLPLNFSEIKLMLIAFLGFIMGYIMMSVDVRDFYRLSGIFFSFETLVLFSLMQPIGLVMITTIGTALVASYLFFIAQLDEAVRSILYPHLRYFRIVLWIGILAFSPVYVGTSVQNIFLALVVVASLIISGPLTSKLSSLVTKKNSVIPLTGKWGAVWSIVGSIYIVSWFMIFYLEIVKPDLSSTILTILAICLIASTFIGYRLLEGSALDRD